MIRITVKTISLLSITVALTACASQRPVLYPNMLLDRVGSKVAEQNIDDCMRRAKEYVSSSGSGADVPESATIGAGTGAATGAAGGAIVGHAGRGAAIGAVGGGVAGLTRGLFRGLFRSRKASPAYRNFVDRCLREKGYDPIGWE